ncbi:MAG: hypothetical protein LC772_10495, partial [Chloroflexi bacterium]|nr:hypothetical protein [Chloroflexota bacterium]
MDSEREEYELALLARNGDRQSLGELVDRTRGRLFAQAYADLRHYEDAQDAVAAALLQICLHVHELRDPALAASWMRSIVRNETRRLRRRAGDPAASLEELDLAAPVADEALKLDVEQALTRVPRDQARALTLFYLKNLPVREIA